MYDVNDQHKLVQARQHPPMRSQGTEEAFQGNHRGNESILLHTNIPRMQSPMYVHNVCVSYVLLQYSLQQIHHEYIYSLITTSSFYIWDGNTDSKQSNLNHVILNEYINIVKNTKKTKSKSFLGPNNHPN